MEFRILGPLEVWDAGRQLQIGGAEQRALLAALLLHANEVVPGDRLIDELWGADSPDSAATALRVNVSRLRKALPPDTLVTRSPGYTIRLGSAELDLYRFEPLVEEARCCLAGGNPADASGRLREALALWRGPALADVSYESFAQAAIARLEEIRLAALELRIEADLALGQDRELVGELEALVVEHPLRERLRGHLMLALYRSGRQAESLNAYQEARRLLVDELGIDPSPSLQALERGDSPPGPGSPSAGSRCDAFQRPRRAVDPRRSAGQSRLDALIAVAEPLARHQARAMILARLVPDADGLGRRQRGSTRSARRSKLAVSPLVRPRSRRARRARSWRDSPPSSTSTSCSPMRPRSSWLGEFRTRSSRRCLPARRAT